MCCRLEEVAGNVDTCLPNGLCQNVRGSLITLWRDACTDQTWDSPYCLKSLDACSADRYANVNVTQRPDSSTYCCGQNNVTCCGTSNGVSLAATLGLSTSTLATQTSSATGMSTTSFLLTTDSASPTSSSTTSSKNRLSTGAKAGLGIGVAVGIAAVAGIAIWGFIRHPNHTKGAVGGVKMEGYSVSTSTVAIGAKGLDGWGNERYEACGSEIAEASGTELHELQGSDTEPRYNSLKG